MAINMWVKDCIRKQSILGFDCDIPEEVDENGFTKEEKILSALVVILVYENFS